MPDLIGTTLGHYRIVDKIGEGGMGEVYRAHDKRLDRDVAVKVLPEEVAEKPDRLARFETEAKAVAKLSHPNILDVYELGDHEGRPFMATELLEGETLRERLGGASLGWRKATEIGAAIADGLGAAHEAGICHRDLKPSNVFLTADGRVKVLDFGLARLEDAAAGKDVTHAPTITRHTDPGTVLGTVGYMSPEQVRGETVDQRSDIFSLGCVLYEMVSGQRAFSGDSAVETMNAILKEEPSDVSTSGVELPPELAGTIRRCLEKRPQARFHSASDLAYNLRSLSSASAASPVRPARRFIVWRKAALWLAAAVVVAAVLVWLNPGGWRSILIASHGSGTSGSIDSLAVLPFVNIGGDEDTEYLSDGIPASIIDRLAKLSTLRVVPRSTAFQFRERSQDLADVGRRLNVRAILTGEIRAQAETLVIRVELVDVTTDRQLWGERLTGTLDDILATEERIATSVSEALRVELSGEDRARLSRGGTSNPEAHRHYLRGRYHRDIIIEEQLRRAVDSFSKAIEVDPGFALAYWGLSETWILLTDWGWEPQEKALPHARRAAEQALALDDSLAEAHGALALLSEYEWDPVTAEREYRRALKLDPNSVDVRQQWAYFLALQDRFKEAIAEVRFVLETDPMSARANRNLTDVLFSAGRHRDAMEQVELALVLDPGDQVLLLYKGRILAGQGRFDEALAELERADGLKGYRLQFLGWVYARSGRTEKARTVLGELHQRARESFVSPTCFALVHAGLGEYDQTFEWLESALAGRDPGLLYLRYFPEWDPIRDDPRFAELISRISYFTEN